MKKRSILLIISFLLMICMISGCSNEQEIAAAVEVETISLEEYINENESGEKLKDKGHLMPQLVLSLPKKDMTVTTSADNMKNCASTIDIKKEKVNTSGPIDVISNFKYHGYEYKADLYASYKLTDTINIKVAGEQSQHSVIKIDTTALDISAQSPFTQEYKINLAERSIEYDDVLSVFQYETTLHMANGQHKGICIKGRPMGVYKVNTTNVYFKDGAYYITSVHDIATLEILTYGYSEVAITTNSEIVSNSFKIVINNDGTVTITDMNEKPPEETEPTTPTIPEETKPNISDENTSEENTESTESANTDENTETTQSTQETTETTVQDS